MICGYSVAMVVKSRVWSSIQVAKIAPSMVADAGNARHRLWVEVPRRHLHGSMNLAAQTSSTSSVWSLVRVRICRAHLGRIFRMGATE